MSNQEVTLAKFTRKEFREALEAGRFGNRNHSYGEQ